MTRHPTLSDSRGCAPPASVIIPCYNHGRYLPDAVRSALQQQDVECEVIIVDDGSTDDTPQAASQFGSDVRYIRQHNCGLSAARNAGLRVARGEFIAVLDADDVYEPAFMQTLIALLEQHPEAGAAHCGYRFVDQDLQPLSQIERRTFSPCDFHRASLDGNFLVPESMLVRRSCYRDAGFFDEDLRACEDWDMWLRISATHSVIGTSEVLARHRILAGSMSTDPELMLRFRLRVLSKHLGPEAGATSSEARRAYGRAYLGSVVEFLQRRIPDRAYDCFASIAYVSPEILTEMDTYYQLACGDQPKGSMGDARAVALERAHDVVLRLLARAVDDPNIRHRLLPLRMALHAAAYRALASLSYNAGRFDMARMFWSRAFSHSERVSEKSNAATGYVKSLLGPRVVGWARSTRRLVLRPRGV